MLAPQDHHLALWLHWEAATLQKQYRAMRAGEWQPTPRQFYTANASVRREHALAAGCFDERFTRAEDVEFACRLEDLGLRFWFEQQAIVWHEPDRSFSSWLKVPYEYGRFDVLMEQEGRRPFVLIAAQELRRRHPLSRMLQRACVGHPSRVRAARALLGFAIRHGNRALPERLGLALCSALFNLQYWQGVVDESGLGADIWQRLQERAAAHARGETSDTLGVHA
jgi:GT2 family glycosyltransferase